MPVPSTSWCPRPLQAFAAWFLNFAKKATLEGANYGLSPTDIDQIEADNLMVQALASSFIEVDTYEKSFTAFRNTLLAGNIGGPTPADPGDLTITMPPIVPTGIYQRVIQYRDVVRSALNYTKEVGESWGIEPATANHPIPGDVKPTINVFAAATNNHASIVVTGRGEATMWDLYVLRKGGIWQKLDTFSGKSADVTIPLTTPGEPEQVQVRVQLRKNNTDYGQVSEPAYLTLNP